MKVCKSCNIEKEESCFPRNGKYIKSSCKDCRKLYDQKQYAKNSEKIKARKKEYRKEAKDNINKLNRKWKQQNKGRFAAYAAKRRAKKLKATPTWADLDYINDLYVNSKEANDIFQGLGLDVSFHVDHIVPLNHDRVCGLHCEDNLQILTATENLQKGNRFNG